MTCKDCIHYEVCQYHIDEETTMTVAECSHGFKNKDDFVEVKHGKWELRQPIYGIRYTYVCSECGRTCEIRELYCHCGAKMDE